MPAYAEARHDINGIDTVVFAAGEGAPIVVLHGGGTAPGFDEVLPLADGARLILPIHPGFGASADDPSIDCVQDYVMHYLELLDCLGLDEVSLVGHSLGGCLASTLALQQPDRVGGSCCGAMGSALRVSDGRLLQHPQERCSRTCARLTQFTVCRRRRPSSSPSALAGNGVAGARGRTTAGDTKLHKWLHCISRRR
jgi:pimeloyl-ACP methyl ester carboxylesterase